MDELPTEAISATGSDYDIEGILILLQNSMDSVRENLEQDCLENAISLLQATLDNGITFEEGRTTVHHQMMRALLIRYSVYSWIEDLNNCMIHLVEVIKAGAVEKFLLVCRGSNENVPDVQSATQLIDVLQKSISLPTVDSIVCTAMEALVSSYNTTYLSGKPRHWVARLRVVLGKALVLKYLINSDVAALYQATRSFQQAEFDCLNDSTLVFISLTALLHVEWVQLIERGDVGAYNRMGNYGKKATATDAEGAHLYKVGVSMVDHAVDDAQLQKGIAFLTASLHCRMEDHPLRFDSLTRVAGALRASFQRKGNAEELASSIVLFREALYLHHPPHPNGSTALGNLANCLWTRFEHKGELEDLEECIALHREALDLRRPPHPNRSSSLNTLAACLRTRFERMRGFEDLDKCIVLYREALHLLRPSDPNRANSLNNLAASLSTRFKHMEAFEDLEESVSLHREALDLREPPHPNRSDSLNNLANSLWTRFEYKRAFEDVEECIALYREALNLFQRSDPNCSHSLNKLATSLLTRFEHIGAFEDLEECIKLYREALELHKLPHPNRSDSLYNLAKALLTRFRRKGAFEDLEECIALDREALDLHKSPHPNRSDSLNNLATSLSTRFRHIGALEDVEECIALYREALGLQEPPHPDRSDSLYNLAHYLSTRFEHKGTFEDLRECIAFHREALDLRQPPHANRSDSLNNLANSLLTCFEHKGAFEDLNECIALHREALDLYQGPHPNRSDSLYNLANSLSTRFKHKGAFEDLKECIALHREALDLRQPPHANCSDSLNNLANSLLTCFEHKGAIEDLKECIGLLREALNLRQPPHPDRSDSLLSLANSLRAHFKHKEVFEDLEECVALEREALYLRQPPHPDRSGSLNNLAVSLLIRFEHKGAFEDLEECIGLHRQALDLRPAPHSDCSDSLNNLAYSLWTRFGHNGAFEDLEECIGLHREALNLRQPPHLNRSSSLNNLAASLSTRFKHKGAFEDLDESVSLHREALDLRKPPHPDRSDSLNNLANALWTRFEHKRVFGDLEEGIALHREALDLRHPPHSNYSNSLNNLATSLLTRFEHKKVSEDLMECIALHRKALDLYQSPHPDRFCSLNNLASSLRTHYEHKGAIESLEECIALEREALDFCQPPHPNRSAPLSNLALSFSARFEHTGSLDDIEKALEYFQDAAKYPTGSLIVRLQASKRWASCAQNHCPVSALDAYKYSMELLPQLASLDLTLQQRQDVLQHGQDLVGNAAKSAINAGQSELAVTFLSIGRSIFWSQALYLRSPVDDLIVAHSDIAQRFISVSRQLENASYSQHPSISSSSSFLAGEPHPNIGTYKRLHLLANERQKIIKEIQSIPGYESFLQPPSFSILHPAAKNGPIILLSVSKMGCDALIVRGDGSVEHIVLPDIDLKALRVLKLLVHTPLALGMRTADIHQDVRDSLQKILGRDMVLETSFSITRDEALWLALKKLWVSAVKPVIDALGIEKTNSPRRLWWCPTGPFSSLPLHAAGIYSDDNKPIDCLFQYAISSYCTSPQDLLHSPPSISQSFKATAVIEPEAPKAGPLPATLTELNKIKKHVPDQRHLIIHVGSRTHPNQVESVLSDIQQSSFVHFGCHGKQDFKNPLESHLLLSGGSLTMSKLIKDCRVLEGALAYLSACETAKGDEERPDESLNLVATMMFAGFRSVVGTLWSIVDNDAPTVADVFYQHLFRKGKDALPDVRDAAYGLHLATQELRDQGRPLYNWVPYVHYGI